jgi:hypothetical protein
MHYKYFIRRSLRDGTPNRRYFKVLYTAALRFGVVLPDDGRGVEVEFSGDETNEVETHNSNRALRGTLVLDGQRFDDVIVIDKLSQNDGGAAIRTFWPVSQHPDAHESYTDPLVDTAVDGTPYDVHIVASVMHSKFKENAGVSPATLMKLIYERENGEIKNAAIRIGELLDASHEREKEALSIVEAYRVRDESTQKEASQLRDELSMLRAAMAAQVVKEKAVDIAPIAAKAVTKKWPSRTGLY